jgi:rifampicin phosphotransferase
VPADHDAVTWLPDPSHYPEQMTPLSASIWFEAMGTGLHEAMRELRGPFAGFETRTDLGWAYEREREPDWEHDPAHLRDAALTLPERWETEIRPRVLELTAELERMRPERPSPGEAVALLDRLWEIVQETWRLHFLAVIPAQIAAELLHEAYVERFGNEDRLAPYRLLEGIPNEAEEELRRLATSARRHGVDDLLRELEPAHALARLRGVAGGRRWLVELGGFLLRFGGRSRWHELSLPREVDLPVLTLESLRLALEADEEPAARKPPPEPPPELTELTDRVRAAYALKELHAYDIDYPSLLATREALLAFCRRLLAEGFVDEADDVWMLTRGELRAALTSNDELRGLVAERRAELERGRREGPKPFLGRPPPQAERHAALDKFYGSQGRSGLSGAAASAGIAEGSARIVASSADFGRVRRGDVLVATTTTPAWTPLFRGIAALVTETGGILSHAAVVAREYGLPAVVGVPDATRTLADGQRVRVDGDRGVVTPL